VEFLNVSKKYDSLLKTRLNSGTVFLGTYAVIQNYPTRAVSAINKEEMIKEIKLLNSFQQF
jgi:hypothetical protein